MFIDVFFPFFLVSPITGEKLLWFQSELDPAKATYTKKDACDIIERFGSGLMFILNLEYIIFHLEVHKQKEREPVHALNCEPISQSVSCPSLW